MVMSRGVCQGDAFLGSVLVQLAEAITLTLALSHRGRGDSSRIGVASCMKTASDTRRPLWLSSLEATGGFEPPNRGFADPRLRPLGYVASLFRSYFAAGPDLVPRGRLELPQPKRPQRPQRCVSTNSTTSATLRTRHCISSRCRYYNNTR